MTDAPPPRGSDQLWTRFWHYWRWMGPVFMITAVAYSVATSTPLAQPVGLATVALFGPVLPIELVAAWLRLRSKLSHRR